MRRPYQRRLTLFDSRRYYPICNEWFSSLLYYVVLPILVILLLRKNPLDFGLRFGNVKAWGFHTVLTCLIAAPVLYAASYVPTLRNYYTMESFNMVRYSLISVISLAATEFTFRGFLLFGLKDKLKEISILVQMVPFVLVHFGKPGLETISTIFTGIYFGYISYRGNSYWPAFIVHLFINIFFIGLVNL
ncbi:MAG: CPBP family intramembrane glutamic endopeptidase [Chloroflexota bacterium]